MFSYDRDLNQERHKHHGPAINHRRHQPRLQETCFVLKETCVPPKRPSNKSPPASARLRCMRVTKEMKDTCFTYKQDTSRRSFTTLDHMHVENAFYSKETHSIVRERILVQNRRSFTNLHPMCPYDRMCSLAKECVLLLTEEASRTLITCAFIRTHGP